MPYPEPIERLIDEFSRMPGIGRRTAERLTFHVLRAPPEEAMALALAVRDVKKVVRNCGICCTVADSDPCSVCADESRDRSVILVVEQPRDLESYEASGYQGLYHVLGGAVSPVDGVEPKHLTLEKLKQRVLKEEIKEVILGVDPDFEGEGTALFVRDTLTKTGVKITRIARGIPAGTSIEYANASVLAEAVSGRREMEDS